MPPKHDHIFGYKISKQGRFVMTFLDECI